MTLLMITRKVDPNDALAGFAYNWVKKIGGNLDTLYVISWQAGDAAGFPENIKVYFLPKNKFIKVLALWKLLWKTLPKVDGLFCHMNPEYTILAGPMAKIFSKKIVSWYTHRAVTWRRRLMERLADIIITASTESFREAKYPAKVRVIGHGIDTQLFTPDSAKQTDGFFRIISVGRISPTKDYETIIKAIDIIGSPKIKLTIIGDVILPSQRQYLDSLRQMVAKMDLVSQVEFAGWVANKDMPHYYQQADLFINMSGTGSVDKVVLEAMACGTMVLTSNEAFINILGEKFMTEKNNPRQLSVKISQAVALTDQQRVEVGLSLRQKVINEYDLEKLAKKIVSQF
ncbi:MAG TPA: glycosyltransferase [bacterium]|nr:glycosyltransferase [bacterium]HNS33670.1 glycosyltransferase [bacterium]